ncbi:MFS alpha-glucoside transporter [Colletotrichum tofieldiae]|nr:MFS alpha-glucoside transporter [Colletotrichum tofieldiae]
MNNSPLSRADSRPANAATAVESQSIPKLMSVDHVTYDAQSFKEYPKAVGFSMVLSLCIVMEAYDTSLIGNFYGLPQFRKRFGSGLHNGTQAGQMIGLFLCGLIAERYGYKKTFLGALEESSAACPGAFQTLTTTYAADVTPLALRPIITTYTNMCWVIGQFISTGVLRALLSRQADWAWRIPYALQWVFPIPIIIGVTLAPESPTWLVRKGRLTDARKALRRLASPSVTDAQLDVTWP